MTRALVALAAGAAIALHAAPADAQTERRFGFVIGYPASAGLQWQAAERVAVRFDASYRRSTLESSLSSTLTVGPLLPTFPPVSRVTVFEIHTSTRHTSVGLELSLLFDLHRSDELRLYLAPRAGVGIARTASATTVDGLGPSELAALTLPANFETTSYTPSGGVAIGASHDVSPRLRIFGETGVSYSRGDLDTAGLSEIEQRSLALHTRVGIVVLF